MESFSRLSDRPTPRVVSDPAEVESILTSHFHFSVAHCYEALTAGHARAALATANSAQSQFGTDFYFGVIEEWRNQLSKVRYATRRYHGLELARRSDNQLQLTACMASDGAGDISGSPRPKNPKGSSSRKSIHDNQGTLGLLAPDARWDPIETWWLLYQIHGIERTRRITAEISLPNNMRSGRDFDWEQRLVLPPIELNDGDVPMPLPEPAPHIEVPIIRRAV